MRSVAASEMSPVSMNSSSSSPTSPDVAGPMLMMSRSVTGAAVTHWPLTKVPLWLARSRSRSRAGLAVPRGSGRRQVSDHHVVVGVPPDPQRLGRQPHDRAGWRTMLDDGPAPAGRVPARPAGGRALRCPLRPSGGRPLDGRALGGRPVGGRALDGRSLGGRSLGGRALGRRRVGPLGRRWRGHNGRAHRPGGRGGRGRSHRADHRRAILRVTEPHSGVGDLHPVHPAGVHESPFVLLWSSSSQ